MGGGNLLIGQYLLEWAMRAYIIDSLVKLYANGRIWGSPKPIHGTKAEENAAIEQLLRFEVPYERVFAFRGTFRMSVSPIWVKNDHES